MEQILKEQIEKFNLTNEVTENPNIWVGCGVIGGEGQPSIEEAKKILEEKFGKCIADNGQETPEWLVKTLKQWENYHPYQHVREKDQPLFVKKFDNGKIIVAVIWPWQIKKGKASLMIYEGKLIE